MPISAGHRYGCVASTEGTSDHTLRPSSSDPPTIIRATWVSTSSTTEVPSDRCQATSRSNPMPRSNHGTLPMSSSCAQTR